MNRKTEVIVSLSCGRTTTKGSLKLGGGWGGRARASLCVCVCVCERERERGGSHEKRFGMPFTQTPKSRPLFSHGVFQMPLTCRMQRRLAVGVHLAGTAESGGRSVGLAIYITTSHPCMHTYSKALFCCRLCGCVYSYPPPLHLILRKTALSCSRIVDYGVRMPILA